MSTNPIARYLAYANLQMAAEALYGYEITSSNPVALTQLSLTPDAFAKALIDGNKHASKFPEALAADFVTKYEIVAHQPNTSTGFSGTLFRAIKDDPATNTHVGDLVLSFRSTEFIDDALRDSVGTNESIGTTGGWAFGQIADMEKWYAELSKPGGPLASRSFDVTGYSLGGHLATAFGILRKEEGTDSIPKHIYTFNGAGTGNVTGGKTLTEVMAVFNSVLSGQEPANLSQVVRDYLMAQAQDKLQAFLNESQRVHSLVPGDGGGANASPDGVFADIRYWYALEVASLNTTGALLAGNNPLSPNYATPQFMLGNMTEFYGSGTTMVASSGLRHSTDRVGVWIEDQPLVRGMPWALAGLASVGNISFSPLRLSNEWTKNDFADTHSLVLIVDSLSVMNALATLAPNLTLDVAADIFKGASTAVKDTGGQGKAEGDVLENVLDALVHTFTHTDPRLRYGETASGNDLNTGNTWADDTLRKNFYDQLAILQENQAFKDLAGKFMIGLPETGTLSNAARTDFASLLTLLTLSPFTLKPVDGAKSLVEESLGAAWPAEYAAWHDDQSLTSAQLANGEGNYTSLFIHDRARLLGWLTQANNQNKTTISDGGPDQWVAEERNYQGASEFLPLSLDINSGLLGTTGDAQRLIFGKDSAGDNLLGGQKDDHLYGMAGNDTLTGGNGADYLEGNADNDSLTGGEGRDSLLGGSGDDTLEGGKEGDTLYGGAGNDTYKFTNGDGWDWIEDQDGANHIEYDGVTLTGGSRISENVWKEERGDKVFWYILVDWTENGQTFKRLSIDGPKGGMFVKNWQPGQLGLILDGAEAPAKIPATTATLNGDSDPGTLTHFPGDSSPLGDRLIGDITNDLLLGLEGNDILEGGKGDDRQQGGNGVDNLYGGAGNDLLEGGGNSNLLYGGAGNDQLWVDQVSTLKDALDETKQTSTNQAGGWMDGGEGNNLMVGGSGTDILIGALEADILIGGGDADFIYGDISLPEINSWSERVAYGAAADKFMREDTPETYQDNPDGETDLLYGGIGNDFLYGQGGDDILDGGSGNDVLYGGAGNDMLVGQAGNDTLRGDMETKYLDDPWHGDDTLNGGEGNDILYGNGGADILFGDAGSDTLYGDEGNDVLVGGDGMDALEGGAGDDTYRMGVNDAAVNGSTLEMVSSKGGGKDRLELAVGYEQLKVVRQDNDIVLRWSDNKQGIFIENGCAGAIDTYVLAGQSIRWMALINRALQAPVQETSSTPNATMTGGGGNDTMTSTGGGANVYGGAGTDTLIVQGGNNTYHYEKGDGTDLIVDSSAKTDAAGNPSPNTLSFGVGIRPQDIKLVMQNTLVIEVGDNPDDAILISGFDRFDALNSHPIDRFVFVDGTLLTYEQLVTHGFDLEGAGGNDILRGTSLDDRISGGAGNDTLEGGTGSDTYLFGWGDGGDTINNTGSDADSIDTLQFQGDLGPADVVLSRISKRLVANDIQWRIAA